MTQQQVDNDSAAFTSILVRYMELDRMLTMELDRMLTDIEEACGPMQQDDIGFWHWVYHHHFA